MATKPYTVVLYKNSSHNFGMYIGQDIPSGVYVVTTEVNSPAAQANIQPGDRVLAVNGQVVSSMTKNPREMISEIARHADILTLSIQPGNLLQNINYTSTEHYPNTSYRYEAKENNGIDHDLENYIKSLFGNQNIQIVPSQSSNRNEYILNFPKSSHRRRRKGQPVQPIQIQPSMIDGPKDVSPQRSIPSMGTPHALLRNSQLISKDSGITESSTNPSAIFNSDYNTNHTPSTSFPAPPQFFNFPQQQQPPPPPPPNNPVNNQANPLPPGPPPQQHFNPPQQSLNNPVYPNGCREIILRRRQGFEGYGFHLQYNKIYYIISQIEPNSPAQQNGLRPNDIILKVNNQTTDKMTHKTFVEIVHSSTEITLFVQPYAEYVRANPKVLEHPNTKPIPAETANNKMDDDKRQNAVSKALTKITSR